MYKLVFPLVLLVSLAAQAEAPSDTGDFRKISKGLENRSSFSGKFDQEKYIKNLDVSIESNGTFSVNKGLIVWNQVEPIAGRFEINDAGIKQKIGDQPEEVLSKDKSPAIAIMSELMICLVNVDRQCLEQKFKIENAKLQKDKKWSFSLTPTQELLSKIIQKVSIKGFDQKVSRIAIEEKSGNSIRINLREK